MTTLTPAMLKGLRWIEDNQPVVVFPVGSPSPATVAKLKAEKLVRFYHWRNPINSGDLKWRSVTVTALGRQLLWNNRK